MRYYCIQCGSTNLRKKTKSNGCLISVIELVLIIAAFFTFGISLLGILIVECCVKKTPVCRKCGCENSLVPMDSPVARKAMAS